MRNITLIIFIIIIIVIVPAASAADSTPSADIKAKLEELKKDIASKAAKLKQEVSKKLKDKTYVGKVKISSPSSLTLTAKTGPKIVSLNQDTVFESSIKSKTKFSQKSIKEEDYLAALGDIDETGVLIARKIILLPTQNPELKTYLWGQVVAISDKLVTLKDKEPKNHAVVISDSSKVEIGNFVILTGILGKNDIFKAEFIYIIPQGGFIKPKKISTPSAENVQPRIYPSPRPQPSKTPRT